MKAWKSTIAILLVLSLFCTLSVSVFAADSGDFSYTVLSESEKTCTLTAYNGTAKTLDIPETLDGYTVTALGQALFIYSRGPDTVTVPKTVTALDKTTFSLSKIMKSVTVAAENPVFSSVDGVLFNKAQTELLYFPVAKAASQYTVPLTVYGTEGSYAQTFAEEKGFAFAVRRTQTVLTLRNPQGTCIVKTDTLTESGESGEQYIVTIPAETVIPWGKSVQEISYSVESHLRYRRALTVTVSSSGTMVYAPTAEDSFTLPYTLTDTDFHADRPTVYPAAVQTRTMQIADADWANAVVGEYADILTFTAAVV